MSGVSNPGIGQNTPNFPSNLHFIVFESFEGLNIKPTRPAIGDQQLYWCENLVPLGKNNLVAIPGESATNLYPLVGTTSNIESFYFFNIKDSFQCFVYFSDGSAEIINASFGASRGQTIASFASGTFSAPNGIGFSQWGNEFLQIVTSDESVASGTQPGDYFLWDGTNLYHSGTVAPNITVLNVGKYYNVDPGPTVPAGSGGGSVAAGVQVALRENGQIIQLDLWSPGSGYTLEDFELFTQNLIGITITNPGSGGADGNYSLIITGGGTAMQGIANFDVLNGSVIGINITYGGRGYTSAPTLSFANCPGLINAAGSATINATATPKIPVVFNSNYNAGAGTGTGAQAFLNLMPFGVTGNIIENFSQRVWVGNDNKINFTAPSNPADFSTTTGGGTITSTDSFLKTSFYALIQANGFLYSIADCSINSISNVTTQTSQSGSVSTLFSNVNVSAQIGTIWGKTPITFGQAIIFANYDGIYALFGGSLQKISSVIDPFFDDIPASISDITISSAQSNIFGIPTYIFLFKIVDQFTNLTKTSLLLWNGKYWFTATQETNYKFITHQEYQSQQFAYGTDGTKIVQMFSGTGETLPKVFRSKLYPEPSYVFNKRATRIVCAVQSDQAVAVPMTIYLENQTWITGSETINYTTAGYTDPKWLNEGQKLLSINVSQTGYMLGFAFLTYDPTIVFQSITLVTQQFNVEF